MAETQHYKLYVEDGDKETFINWRKKINGSNNSNMTKIDTALNDKAEKSVSVEGTLSSASWSGESAPFVQTIAVTGLGKDQNGDISLPQSISDEALIAARNANLRVTGQEENSLTITAIGAKPSVDIPVIIRLLG